MKAWLMVATIAVVVGCTAVSSVSRQERLARVAAVADGMCSITNVVTLGTSGVVRIDFVLKAEPGSDIRCRAELAPPEKWDGRFWGVGNSSLGGKIPKIAHYRRMGTAVVTTDIGTWSVVARHLDVGDWPLAVRRDYSWRSTHLMTVYGKRIVEAYYGKAPQRSYFNGGSCGGRQAFSEAIRFPEDYDGIVAHLPANNYVANRFNAWLAWNSTHDAAGRLVFSDEEMRVFADAAVEWRAAKDPAPYAGRFLADGRIDVAELDGILAVAAKKIPSLLEGDKPARLKALHSPLIVDGECLSLGFAPGTYLGQRMKRKVSSTTTCQTIRAFAMKDGPWYNANSADLSPFFARGGKLIVTTGWEDQTISPLPIVEHYERLCAHEGGLENAMKHCRLFCAPGAAHGGGKGRATQGELGGDFVRQAIIGWVERGVAPDRIMVNDRTRNETFPVATYPGLFVKGAGGEWTRVERPRTKPQLADFIFACDRTPAGL